MAKAKKKGEVEVVSGVETISVDIAREMLANQKKNRPLKMSKVKHLAKEIADKRWAVNGESIVIDVDGSLLDGQHRLSALVHAAEKIVEDETLTITSVVVRGIPRELFATIDQGEKRSLADVVAIDDHAYPSDLAVALRLLAIRLAGKKVSGTGRMSHTDNLALLHEHGSLGDWVSWVVELGKDEEDWLRISNLISPGYFAAICHLAALSAETTAIEDFAKNLVDQTHTTKGSPAFALRKVLLANRKDTASKLKRDTLVSMVVKALTAHLEDEEILTLKLREKEYPLLPAERPSDAPESDSDE